MKIAFSDPAVCEELIRSYVWPSEALWRAIELDVLQNIHLERPAIDVGFGSGASTRVLYGHLDAGLDTNPKAVRRAHQAQLFDRVYCADISDPPASLRGTFRTVLCNSVLEHVPDLSSALGGCAALLEEGGALVATVPTAAMNGNLQFRSRRYTEWRQRRLRHVNLLDPTEWEALGIRHGLALIRAVPYLTPSQTRLWDRVDLPASAVSAGGVTPAVILRLSSRTLPKAIRRYVARRLATLITKQVITSSVDSSGYASQSCLALVFKKHVPAT
jgi:SAM-dependent methyltransferase